MPANRGFLWLCPLLATCLAVVPPAQSRAPQASSPQAPVVAPSPESISGGDPNVCGTWSEATSPTGAEFITAYGEIRSCMKLDPQPSGWLVATLGTKSSRGVVALYPCTNDACRDGRLDHPFAGWVVYPAPHRGGVTPLGRLSPTVLIVDNGGYELAFDLSFRSFGPNS